MKKTLKFFMVLMLSVTIIVMNTVTVSASEESKSTEHTKYTRDTYQLEQTSYLGNSMNLYVSSSYHAIGAEIELIIYTSFSSEIVDIIFSGDGFGLTNDFEIIGDEIHFSVTHILESEDPLLSVNVLLDNGESFTARLFGIVRDEQLYINPYSYGLAQNAYLKHSGEYDAQKRMLDTLKENAKMTETANTINFRGLESRSANEASSVITGQIKWFDANRKEQPLRFCKVEFYERYNDVLVDYLGETYTDKNGNYSFEFFEDEIDVTVILYAQGTDITVCDDGEIPYWSWEEYEEHAVLENIALGSIVNLDLSYDYTEDFPIDIDRDFFPRALQVAQAAICASMYYEAMKGSDVEDVKILYPYYTLLGSETTHYKYSTKSIYLVEYIEDEVTFDVNGQIDCFESWDVITHEYGHHVANCEGIDDSPGKGHYNGDMAEHYKSHFVNSDFDECEIGCAVSNDSYLPFSEDQCKYKGSALAWSEGYATFFGELAQQYFKENYIEDQWVNAIPTFADYSYYAYNFESSYDSGRISIEENDPTEGTTEFGVYRILFDLYDSDWNNNTETFDNVSLSHQEIWNYVVDSGTDIDGDGEKDHATKPKTLYQFIEYLRSSDSGYPKSQLSNLNAILAKHGLAAEAPTIPSMISASPLVEFEWSTSVLTTYFDANKFQVNFYDENYNLIGSTEPQVVSLEFMNDYLTVIYSGTITVDSQLWQTVMSYPSSFYVSITMYECNGNINNSIYNEHTTSFESPYTMYSIPVHVHSYTHDYVKNNSLNHKAYCVCGEYILENHFFVAGMLKTSCRDCGYIATGNVPIIKPTAIYIGDELFGFLPIKNETALVTTEKYKNREDTI